MLGKDFENLEIRLQKIREESSEIFDVSEKFFTQEYEETLQQIFTRDILAAKRNIKALFQLEYVDQVRGEKVPDNTQIFSNSVSKVIKTLPLDMASRQNLEEKIIGIRDISSQNLQNYYDIESLQRDPMYPIVEDLLQEGSISSEEFLLFQKAYGTHKNIHKALDVVPEHTRTMISGYTQQLSGVSEVEQQKSFKSEFHEEIRDLEKRGFDIYPALRFVSRSYFKSAGKLKKYESPKRRMKRTFKMALLRILRMKFGTVDAEKLLVQFDQCETFTEMMILIYQLFEILGEKDETKESFQAIEEIELIEKLITKAEDTKEKILKGEKVTAKISSLIGDTDSELEEGILEKILDNETDFLGDEILFSHEKDNMAGIYAEVIEIDEEDQKEDDVIDIGDTLEGNYQSLKDRFTELDEEKRKAFLEGEYDKIDIFNERLLNIESKIFKIAKLLGEEI